MELKKGAGKRSRLIFDPFPKHLKEKVLTGLTHFDFI